MDIINKVFKQYLHMFVIIFMDYELLYSKKEDDHINYLRIVLKILKVWKLYEKFSKYVFWLRFVAFIGHIVLNMNIVVDLIKIIS